MLIIIRMAQSSGTTADLGKVILPTNLEFDFFSQLKRNSQTEPNIYDKRPLTIPIIEPYRQTDKILMSFNELYHSSDQILKKIPYEDNNSRMLLDNYNGRNLNLLNSIKANGARDYPDIQTQARQVLGRIK